MEELKTISPAPDSGKGQEHGAYSLPEDATRRTWLFKVGVGLNALAGALEQSMGRDLTSERGTCGHCGNPSMVAELVVYPRAPSRVARCPHCGDVVMVVTEIRDTVAVHFSRYEL